MALFRGSRAQRFEKAPKSRRIPDLNPAYFAQLKDALATWGGDESLDQIAAGVANAMLNTSVDFYERMNFPGTVTRLRKNFADVAEIGPDAADHIVNFVLIRAPEMQETFETLLARLLDVYSRPPGPSGS